jgi:hypothetical protein
MPSPESLYRGLMLSADLDVNLQHRILRYGQTDKRSGLLETLAHHPALDTDVDNQLLAVSSVDLRVAWLTRPGRDPRAAAAAIRDDKRVKPCTVAAAIEGMPQDAYERLHTRDFPPVQLALLTNPSVELGLRRRVAAKVAENVSGALRIEAHTAVANQVKATPQIANELALNTTSLSLIEACAASPGLEPGTVDVLLTQFDRYLEAATTGTGPRAEVIKRQQNSWMSIIRDLALLPQLTQQQAVQILTMITDQGQMKSIPGVRWTNPVTEAMPRLRQLISNPVDQQDLDAARNAGDGDLQGWVERAATVRNPLLTSAVAGNPHLTPELARRLRETVYQKETPISVILSHDERPAVQAALAGRNGLIASNILGMVADPHTVLLELLRHNTAAGVVKLTTLHTFKQRTEEHLRALPIRALCSDDPDVLRRELAELINREVTTAEQWELLEGFSDDYHMSVGELLNAVHLTARTGARNT